MGYFDGAEQKGYCSAGCFLVINDDQYYEISLGCGKGSNTRAELLALWALLFFATLRNVNDLQIMGDSSAILDWVL